VLRTIFRTRSGSLELIDTLAMAKDVRGHAPGERSPHVLLRHARRVDGRVELDIEFVPRYEYGLTTPLVSAVEGGVVAAGGPTTLRLSTSVPLEIDRAKAMARVSLEAGHGATFAVHESPTWDPLPEPWSDDSVVDRNGATTEAWRSWSAEHQRYDGPYAELVRLSGRVLQGLTFQPTGALVAHRRRPSPRASAESATGTIATPGYVTPA
jgi:GH15 family glucan-1,4-alpha-glucosidase